MDDLLTTTACTLPTAARPMRLAEFDALFSESVQSIERDGAGLRLRLSGDHGLRERVRDLAERETACCSFFTFVVEGAEDDVTMSISVPPEHRGILTALADRAAELAQ